MSFTTAGLVIAGVAITVPKLILTGVCLGVGFWAAKKFTNWIDIKLVNSNPQVQAILDNPYSV